MTIDAMLLPAGVSVYAMLSPAGVLLLLSVVQNPNAVAAAVFQADFVYIFIELSFRGRFCSVLEGLHRLLHRYGQMGYAWRCGCKSYEGAVGPPILAVPTSPVDMSCHGDCLGLSCQGWCRPFSSLRPDRGQQRLGPFAGSVAHFQVAALVETAADRGSM